MLPHPRNRLSRSPAADARSARPIQKSVAKIYGPPDETVTLGAAEAWYFYGPGIAILFVGREISKIYRLRPRSRAD